MSVHQREGFLVQFCSPAGTRLIEIRQSKTGYVRLTLAQLKDLISVARQEYFLKTRPREDEA